MSNDLAESIDVLVARWKRFDETYQADRIRSFITMRGFSATGHNVSMDEAEALLDTMILLAADMAKALVAQRGELQRALREREELAEKCAALDDEHARGLTLAVGSALGVAERTELLERLADAESRVREAALEEAAQGGPCEACESKALRIEDRYAHYRYADEVRAACTHSPTPPTPRASEQENMMATEPASGSVGSGAADSAARETATDGPPAETVAGSIPASPAKPSAQPAVQELLARATKYLQERVFIGSFDERILTADDLCRDLRDALEKGVPLASPCAEHLPTIRAAIDSAMSASAEATRGKP